MTPTPFRTFVFSLLVASCNGTTGDSLITFPAYAQGAPGAADFSLNGYDVHLTLAHMHVGALYMNEAPIGTSAETPVCINPGIYGAQVAGPVDVDLLSTSPQPWVCNTTNCPPVVKCQADIDCQQGSTCNAGLCTPPVTIGNGTADLEQSWELWLTDATPNLVPADAGSSSQNGGDSIDSVNFDPVVDLEGIATRQSDGQPIPFAAIVSINQLNRGQKTTDPAQPGLDPICKQRIVLIGGISIQLHPGGALYLTIDPRPWFTLETGLDFASLPLITDPVCTSSAPPNGDPAVSIDPGSSFGTPTCLANASNGLCPRGTQFNPLICTTDSTKQCLATRCIPNSNNASGAVGTDAASLYKGIISGGSAYSLAFSQQQ